tara:strand:- start:2274 stop:2435 length:162 start_codon:yes stop_codon:yes gene_type:complete
MLISEIQETDVLSWLEQADDAPKIIIRVLNGSWSYRDLAEVISIWNYEEGLDD